MSGASSGRRGRDAVGRSGHHRADGRSPRRAAHRGRRPHFQPTCVVSAAMPTGHARTVDERHVTRRGRTGRSRLCSSTSLSKPRPQVRPGRQLARVRTARPRPCAKTTQSSRRRLAERSRRRPRCSAFSVRAPATCPRSSFARSRSTARGSATAGSSRPRWLPRSAARPRPHGEDSVHDFVFVDDVVDGIVAALAGDELSGRVINLGTGSRPRTARWCGSSSASPAAGGRRARVPFRRGRRTRTTG